MHFQGLDLNLLIALDALLSEKNVTRAAERMHISQPGMSAALQKLRYHFDDRLLERVGRRMELTARARTLADPVKSILFDIRNLQGPEQAFDPTSAHRTFRLSATTYCCEVLAIPLLRKMKEQAPGVSIHFEELSTDTVNRIGEGQIDFAITISARIIDGLDGLKESLRSRDLFSDTFVVAMSRDNPFEGDTISFNELCEMRYAETRFAGVIAGITEQIWKQQPHQPQICAWLPNFQLTLETVGRTQLVTILPALLAELKGERLNIRTLPVPFEVPRLDEQLYWHVRNDNDPGHAWMVSQLEEVVRDLRLGNRSSSDYS